MLWQDSSFVGCLVLLFYTTLAPPAASAMMIYILTYVRLPAHTFIERYVTVGASSLLRSCTIEPECIVGQHSILMEGSLMETHSILEAGSVLPPGRRIPTGELWAGNPARFVRTLTHEETLEIPKLAVAINDLSTSHFSEFLPYSTAYLEVEKLKKSFGISI
ncbi:Gamma carbonic anhydrase-like 2, mitochondrial [Vitis vinifera]|uniref:Gamma carbonic anhydrase-like 2, mitochondrial n=1 Tax=Vitis vinifera TaxID=29760 RepID=A0A438EXS7_VITVI|nr:Gamma carbonic anhydrase-like 2, mitochondrial [Vitis vinifera]